MASPLLTVEQIKEIIASRLKTGDAAIQRLIDAADENLVTELGPHPPADDGTLTVDIRGGYRALILPQRAKSISSVTERDAGADPAGALAVAAGDYLGRGERAEAQPRPAPGRPLHAQRLWRVPGPVPLRTRPGTVGANLQSDVHPPSTPRRPGSGPCSSWSESP